MDNQGNHKQNNVKKKVKRFRSAFTTDQLNYLEKKYKRCPYVSKDQRKEISTKLNITERAIKIWYQNRRMKEKRESGGQDFENEQYRQTDYTKYSKRLSNDVIKSPNYEPSRSPIVTNEKKSDKNVTANHLTRTDNEKIDQFIDSALVTASYTENIVATTKTDDTVTDALSKESKTEQLLDVSKKDQAKNLSTTVNNKNPNLEELDKSKKNLSTNTTKQIQPENLTLNENTNEPVAVPEDASSDPGITSVPTVPPFNMQSYGPIFWNQTGVPIIPTGTSISSSSSSSVNAAPSSQDNVTIKRCWHCDPNIRQLMMQVSYTLPQQDPNFQYIITAVPIQTPSTSSS